MFSITTKSPEINNYKFTKGTVLGFLLFFFLEMQKSNKLQHPSHMMKSFKTEKSKIQRAMKVLDAENEELLSILLLHYTFSTL